MKRRRQQQRNTRERKPSMRNILAIANKELRSYFASPIAYIVIGVFALLYGYFFVAILAFFVRQSMQMSQFGGRRRAIDEHQSATRPAVALGRDHPDSLHAAGDHDADRTRRRSVRGRSSCCSRPRMTDFQIVIGKFLGALALYGVMLAVTLVHMAILFTTAARSGSRSSPLTWVCCCSAAASSRWDCSSPP